MGSASINKQNVIAIDGPAGSGKSTIAQEVAKRLRLLYVDTGAMYRAFTMAVVKADIALDDEEKLSKLASEVDIQLSLQGEVNTVLLNGVDVTREIRLPKLTDKVKFIAKVAGVRSEMVKLQRKAAASAPGAVLEGRDIGSVVFPDAKCKIYLDAKPSERAKRRYKQLKHSGQKVKLENLVRDIQERDESDMKRKVAPLIKADDAIYLDTTNLSITEVVEKVIKICTM